MKIENNSHCEEKNPVRKQTRLDLFLISDNISQTVMDSQIIPGFRTDHNSIILKLRVGCFGFNGPLRQYFSLYRAVSQREGDREGKG